MGDVLSKDAHDIFFEIVGYLITADMGQQKAFLLKGDGAVKISLFIWCKSNGMPVLRKFNGLSLNLSFPPPDKWQDDHNRAVTRSVSTNRVTSARSMRSVG